MENAADTQHLSNFTADEIHAILQGVLYDISKVAGICAAIKVAVNLRCTNLAIYPGGIPDEKLVKVVGTEAAHAIAKAFGRNVLVYLCVPCMPVGHALLTRFYHYFGVSEDDAHDVLALGLSEKTLIQNMPPMLASIAWEIGVPLTLAFEREFGGQQIYLSSNPKPDSRLVHVVGTEAAKKLVNLLGGNQHFIVPAGFKQATMRRLKGIRMHECGASANSISKTLGISRSVVMGWKSRYLDPSDIGSMKIKVASKPADGDDDHSATDGAIKA